MYVAGRNVALKQLAHCKRISCLSLKVSIAGLSKKLLNKMVHIFIKF